MHLREPRPAPSVPGRAIPRRQPTAPPARPGVWPITALVVILPMFMI